MRPIHFFVLLLIVACVSQIEAGVYTRLIYNNADCSGFHVAYVYMASTDQTCSLSGCTEILPGKFWAKENCASVVTPRSQDGFSVVVESLSADCSVSTETGAVADTCIAYESTAQGTRALKISSCTSDGLDLTWYSDADCTQNPFVMHHTQACTAAPVIQRYFNVLTCPLAGSPRAVPVGSGPAVPSPNAEPTPSPVTPNPIGTTPSAVSPAARVPNAQPSASQIKSSNAEAILPGLTLVHVIVTAFWALY